MSDPPIDREKLLLQEVSAGNPLAFRRLADQYFPVVYNYVFKITDDRAVSEEVVQDIFLQLWLTRETLIEVNNFGGYLFVVSRNYALNAIKKMLRARSEQVKWENQVIRISEEESAEPYHELLEEAIARLSPQQQRAWILTRQLRLSYEEAAGEMNISKETIKKYLQIASASILHFLKSRKQSLSLVLLLNFF